MRIAQIVCSFPPYAGGIGQSAKRFGDILKSEHEIVTFTLTTKNLTATNQEDGVKYLKPLFRYGHGGLPFSLLFSLRKFDTIYLHYPFFGATELVWLFLLFNKKKLVIHYHMDTSDLPWFLKLLAIPSQIVRKSLFNKAHKIISGSLDYLEKSQIAELLKNNPDKFCEIPFGIDTNFYAPKTPASDNGLIAKTKKIISFVTRNFIKKGRVNLLFVGGLDSAHYFKGLFILFDALVKLKYKYWRLNIIGSGNLENDYKLRAANLGLEKKIKFLGRVDEITLIKTYQDSDIFILPSINGHEAFGLVLIEAMACGVPVIASDLPGVRKVFRDSLDGLTVKSGDARDLAEKLAELISNEPKRIAMARSARSYAIEKYSWERIAQRFKEAFL